MYQHIEKNDHSQITLAAGGIAQRISEKSIEILIIKRERYDTKWCLPKGKLNNDESLRNS